MNIIRLYKLISSLLPEKKHHVTPVKGIRAVCFDMFFTLGNCHIVPDNGEAIALGIP